MSVDDPLVEIQLHRVGSFDLFDVKKRLSTEWYS